MANENLKGKKVAILVTDGFEQVELLQPREALNKAGAETKVVSLKEGPVKGWDMTKWGKEVPADLTLDSAKPDDFDALLLPGGVINPDKLRMEPKAVAFVKSFFDSGKPVAAICHGPWMVVEAGAARGRKSRHGLRSRPIFAMPALNGWIKKLLPTATWSLRASLTTFRLSIAL